MLLWFIELKGLNDSERQPWIVLRALKLNPLQKEIKDFIQKFGRDGLETLNENALKIIYYRKKRTLILLINFSLLLKLINHQ
jgi:hypothetical protein